MITRILLIFSILFLPAVVSAATMIPDSITLSTGIPIDPDTAINCSLLDNNGLFVDTGGTPQLSVTGPDGNLPPGVTGTASLDPVTRDIYLTGTPTTPGTYITHVHCFSDDSEPEFTFFIEGEPPVPPEDGWFLGEYSQSFSIALLGMVPIPVLFMIIYVPVLGLGTMFRKRTWV